MDSLADPAGRFGGGRLVRPHQPNLPPNFSPRISATLFWKTRKNINIFFDIFWKKEDFLTPTFQLNGYSLWQWRPHWRLEEAQTLKRISSKLDANCQRRFHGASNKADTYWDIGQKWGPMIVRGDPESHGWIHPWILCVCVGGEELLMTYQL